MLDRDIIDELPDAPFKVVHNGASSLGSRLQLTEDGLTFWDGSRTQEISGDYSSVANNGRVRFTSRRYGSKITLSPLSLSDKNLLIDSESIETIEQLQESAMQVLDALLLPQLPAEPEELNTEE